VVVIIAPARVSSDSGCSADRRQALAALEERYPKIEIDRTEYLEKKQNSGG